MKVSLTSRLSGNISPIGSAVDCYVSVDDIDCPLEEPTLFSSSFYFQKLNRPRLQYDTGVRI